MNISYVFIENHQEWWKRRFWAGTEYRGMCLSRAGIQMLTRKVNPKSEKIKYRLKIRQCPHIWVCIKITWLGSLLRVKYRAQILGNSDLVDLGRKLRICIFNIFLTLIQVTYLENYWIRPWRVGPVQGIRVGCLLCDLH
jgi:hypothetical protein